MPDNIKTQAQLVDLKVAIDNHIHHGKPCKKGEIVKVSPQVKEMLEMAWAQAEKVTGSD